MRDKEVSYFTYDQELQNLYLDSQENRWNVETATDWSLPIQVGDDEKEALKVIVHHAACNEHLSLQSLGPGLARYIQHYNLSHCISAFTEEEARHAYAFGKYFEKLTDRKLPQLLKPEAEDIAIFKKLNKASLISPGGVALVAVLIETVGCSTFEYLYSKITEPVLSRLLGAILTDEKRHVRICSTAYKLFHNTGSSYEARRNRIILTIARQHLYREERFESKYFKAVDKIGSSREMVDHVKARICSVLSDIDPELGKTAKAVL